MSERTKLKLISGPITSPISLEEAKDHLRELEDYEDTLIQQLIDAATDYSESFLGRALVDQTWELVLDGFTNQQNDRHYDSLRCVNRHLHDIGIKIPKPPLIEIVSVKYDDVTGAEQTVDPSDYSVDAVGEPGRLIPTTSWPTTRPGANSVRIQFRCGYLDQGSSPASQSVPSSIKAAIKLMIGDLYDNRETIVTGVRSSQIPWTTQILLQRYRFDLSMA